MALGLNRFGIKCNLGRAHSHKRVVQLGRKRVTKERDGRETWRDLFGRPSLECCQSRPAGNYHLDRSRTISRLFGIEGQLWAARARIVGPGLIAVPDEKEVDTIDVRIVSGKFSPEKRQRSAVGFSDRSPSDRHA